MSGTEKEEGQKTVVAFIAGLLIGGLLVWVFSASPESKSAATNTLSEAGESATELGGDITEEAGSLLDGAKDAAKSAAGAAAGVVTGAKDKTVATVEETATVVKKSQAVTGNMNLKDQSAGSVVSLTDINFPTEAGWVAVRDYENGVGGRILGAARWDETVGLMPTEVELLRNTESGNTYQIVFYTEDGDRTFDLTKDAVIDGHSATFAAK